ncbi:MAG: tRNA pseudouridine(38-40) synthase TruA [Chlamydiia bacterium]|nr:tRNA pseudouridine(38-40) synthase TruA [Chlamydiia bacterium]
MPVKNIKILLSYDGTPFLGWGEIETRLCSVFRKVLRENIWLQGSSRTDRGVHAKEQVINFFTHQKNLNLNRLKWSFNQLLPKEISIMDIKEVPLSFHPTLDAAAKQYSYYLCTQPIQLPEHRLFSWHVPYQLDVKRMKETIQYFVGTQDFEALCNQRATSIYSSYVRVIHSLEIIELGNGRFCIEVVGKSFLYKMVRNLVGTLVCVGRGKLSLDKICHLLKSKDRTQAGITAPPHGLFLNKIFYPSENQENLPKESL